MSEDPLTNPEEIWYTDESSFILDGKRIGRYVVVSSFETIEARSLPPGTSAQLAELIALTRDLGKSVTIYTDSKYAFLVLHVHAAIWKERGHLTTLESPVKYGDQMLRFLEEVHLPAEVSVSHCEGHHKGNTEVARGNQAVTQEAKRAALQSNELTGIMTLVPQTNLPETSSYTEGETPKAKSKGFQEDHMGWSQKEGFFFCLGTSNGSWLTPLGGNVLQRLLERSFRGTVLQTTIRQTVSSCLTCH